MSRDRVPVAGPWVTELEVQFVADAAANDWYREAGKSVGLFEREFADYLGIAHAAAVPHGTSALHLAMLALDLQPGDEVIVPDATWVATAAPLMYERAIPVFADVDERTWGISAESVERCLTERTRAVVTVDLYGGTPDMDALDAVLAPRALPVLEDAAQAIGTTWNGRPAGTLGDVAVFSFHGTKTLTTGEGGMLVTDRDDLFARASRLRDHGRTPNDHRFFVTDELGYKYKMSSLQAAFGRAQLQRIDELLGRKRQIFDWYEARLRDVPGLSLNPSVPGMHNTYWMVTVVVDAGYGLSTRDLMARLDDADIDSRPFFPPLSSLPAFDDYATAVEARSRNTVAYDLSTRSVNLPSALMLTEDDVDRVCEAFVSILGGTKVVDVTKKTVSS
jgi:perosamine synthetase